MNTAWRGFHAKRESGEDGFTLVELTISIVVMTLVIGAVTVALTTIFHLSGSTSARISDAGDAQEVSASLSIDVQSAEEITTANAATAPGCGTGTGTQLLGLEWEQEAGQSNTYEIVISYLAVKQGNTWSLVRDYCNAGSSPSPTTSETVSYDICEPSGVSPSEAGCQQPQAPPTITPTAENTAAGDGWISAASVTGVSFSITEPGSEYSYTLVADPEAASAAVTQGSGSTFAAPSTTCGYATPGTGTYAPEAQNGQALCFVTFSGYQYSEAAYPNCQTMTEGLAGTPFTLSFCLSVLAGTESNDEAPPSNWTSSGCNGSPGSGSGGVPAPPNPPPKPFCSDPSSADIVAVPLPTYTDPPTSEAFLGNNGFYTGVPGDPALYTYLEGTSATLYFTNIKVLGANGNPATNWDLVTGDAESTDTGESITWSTCPATSNGGLQVTCSGAPYLSLVPNQPAPAPPYGNACLNTEYDQDWLTTGSLAPGLVNGATQFAVGAAAQEVECAGGVSTNKTGTVMLEAPEPSDLTVNLVGTGLQAAFIGFLL